MTMTDDNARWNDDPGCVAAIEQLNGLPVPKDMVRHFEAMLLENLPPNPPLWRVTQTAWALLETALASEPLAKPDCRRGCSYCCSLPVVIYGIEAQILAKFASRSRALKTRIAARARAGQGLSTEAYTEAKIPCAFLGDEGECTVYAWRPWGCRYWHSMDVRRCEAGFGVANISIPLDSNRVTIVKAVALATGKVMGRRSGKPRFGIGGKGELHAMVLRAIDRR